MDAALAAEPHCYLTTVGRLSGRPHSVEIWFALNGRTILMLSGKRERADWVANAMRHPGVAIRIGRHIFDAQARIVTGVEEDALARRLLRAKYETPHQRMDTWLSTALPVAFDLEAGRLAPDMQPDAGESR